MARKPKKKNKGILSKIKNIKGSTIIITFMYLTWIAYIVESVKVYTLVGEWLPTEITVATAGLFIVETVSLARLKMAKEGTDVGEKKSNPFLEQIGLSDMPDFEEEVQEELAQEELRGAHCK